MIETFWYRKIESIHLDHGLEGGCWSKTFDYDAFSFGGVWVVSRSRGLLVFLLLLLLLLLLLFLVLLLLLHLHLHLHLPLLLLSSSFSFVRTQVFGMGCDVWMLDSDTPAEFCSFFFLFLVSIFLPKIKKDTL